MLRIQKIPVPLTNFNSLRETKRKTLVAKPSAMADTSASGAEVAMEV